MAYALWKSTAGTAEMNGPAEFVGPGQGGFVNALVIGEDNRAYTRVSVDGTLDYFSIYVQANARVTDCTLTLRNATTATDLFTITIPALTIGWFTAGAASAHVNAGDFIYCPFRVAVSDGSKVLNLVDISVRFLADDPTTTVTRLKTSTASSLTTLSPYYAPIGQAVYSGSEATRQYHVAGDGVVDHFAVFLTTNTRDADSTLHVRVNGLNSGLSITIPAATIGWFTGTGGPITVAAGDMISYYADINAGTGSYHQSTTELDFISSDGQITGGLGQTVRTYAGGDAHYPLTGATNTIGYDDEALLDFTLNAIEVYVSSNARSVESYLVLEVNGVDVLTATIPAIGTGWFSAVGTVVIQQGDLVAVYLRGAADGVNTLGFTIIDWWGEPIAIVPPVIGTIGPLVFVRVPRRIP